MSDGFPIERAVERIDVLLDMGRVDEAADLTARALQHDPRSAALLIQLTRVALLRWDYPAAVDAASAALVIEPDSATALRMLAAGLSGCGQPYDALAVATTAIERDPHDPLCFRQRAAVLFNNASVMRRPGRLYDLTHNLYLALDNIDQAIELMPHWAPFHVLRGQILKRLSRIPEARQAWEQALSIDPTNSRALELLAAVDLTAERLGRARQHVEAGLGVDPQSTDLRRHVGKLAARRMFVPLWLASVPTGVAFVARPARTLPLGAVAAMMVIVTTTISVAYAGWWWAHLPSLDRRTLLSGSARWPFRLGVVVWIAFTLIGVAHLAYVPPPLAVGEETPNTEVLLNLPVAYCLWAPFWLVIQRGWAITVRAIDRRLAARGYAKFVGGHTMANLPTRPNLPPPDPHRHKSA